MAVSQNFTNIKYLELFFSIQKEEGNERKIIQKTERQEEEGGEEEDN